MCEWGIPWTEFEKWTEDQFLLMVRMRNERHEREAEQMEEARRNAERDAAKRAKEMQRRGPNKSQSFIGGLAGNG